MTGLLALVGGGEWTDGCDFDQSLIDASGASEVAVLPTGSAYENPGHLLDRAGPWFAALGLSVVPVDVLTRRDAFDEEATARVAAARFIYLAGASAMHLRSVLKDTPVLAALVGAWESGAALAGTNAGADVLCDPMVDSRGGAFTVGLGLVSPLGGHPALRPVVPRQGAPYRRAGSCRARAGRHPPPDRPAPRSHHRMAGRRGWRR